MVATAKLWCESMTDLGGPVVPLENRTQAVSSLPTSSDRMDGSCGRSGVSVNRDWYHVQPG